MRNYNYQFIFHLYQIIPRLSSKRPNNYSGGTSRSFSYYKLINKSVLNVFFIVLFYFSISAQPCPVYFSPTSTFTCIGGDCSDSELANCTYETVVCYDLTTANNVAFRYQLYINGNNLGNEVLLTGLTTSGCNTLTFQNQPCNASITLDWSGSTNPNGGGNQCAGATGITLPVELLSFNYQQINDNIILDWATSSEINNDYFLLQKSKNGVEYNDLVKIKGNGVSSVTNYYSYTDRNPHPYDNYYRLRQFDYDGNVAELGIIYIKYKPLESVITFNPTEKSLNILSNLDAYKISIFDISGNKITSYNSNQPLSKIFLESLGTGIYLVTLSDNEFLTTKKIIVY